MREMCHSEPCLHCEDTVIMFVFSEPKVVAKVKRQVWTAAATDAFFEGLCQVILDCLESKDTHVACVLIDGVYGVWLQFWRARVRVCLLCSCVRNKGKKALHQALTISAER